MKEKTNEDVWNLRRHYLDVKGDFVNCQGYQMYFALTKSPEDIKIDNTLTIWLKALCSLRKVDFARGEKTKDRALEVGIVRC